MYILDKLLILLVKVGSNKCNLDLDIFISFIKLLASNQNKNCQNLNLYFFENKKYRLY